jgi:hypothetical protein
MWTTNESGGSETVIDADTNQVAGTVALGGQAGNVYYDPVARQMLVDVAGAENVVRPGRSRLDHLSEILSWSTFQRAPDQ